MNPALARLRLRLTLWYGGVFTLILALLGGGIFLAVRHQLARQLDASLRTATAALQRAARIREVERARATGPVVDAVTELHIPDRELYLLDGDGVPVAPPVAPDWIRAAARRVTSGNAATLDVNVPGGREVRLHAERFSGGSGTSYLAVALADRVELEDRYASLIEVFVAAALVALLLVAGGGYVLVRQSTAPVERSMEQMRRFMADAAHELRTPVTLLRTRADVALGQERAAERDAETLRAVGREAERIGAIVGDLLTLARADAGERPAARETLYLDDQAADAVESIRALAQRAGVALEVGAFEEAPVTGDPVLVRRLLLILLENAVKFTPPGGHVRLDVAVRDGQRAVVISDTGPGIAPADLPHVFERFYRGESARQGTEGAGLGLAIARWIADLHDARIDIQSSPGDGTRVAVSFPSL
ncbi:MAG TPA: HAMP domain-containing sensor histidine kinase [Gemmatimonadales bacterium]|nr:HAMP domain-containing sensor histidine kinase [Gemmatimonadales bacterium]